MNQLLLLRKWIRCKSCPRSSLQQSNWSSSLHGIKLMASSMRAMQKQNFSFVIISPIALFWSRFSLLGGIIPPFSSLSFLFFFRTCSMVCSSLILCFEYGGLYNWGRIGGPKNSMNFALVGTPLLVWISAETIYSPARNFTELLSTCSNTSFPLADFISSPSYSHTLI